MPPEQTDTGAVADDAAVIEDSTIAAAEVSLASAVPTAAISVVSVDRARSKRLGIFGWLCVAWIVIVFLMAVVPGIFPVPELTERSRDAILNDDYGPQPGHPLGLDQSGYDMLTKVIYGTRASMIVSVGGVLFALVIGGGLGLISGYFKGKLDVVLTGVFNVMLAFPPLILALAAVTVFANSDDTSYARSVLVVTLALGVISIPILGRITRVNAMAWSEREFVLAAKLLGTRTHRVISRDLLPNVAPAMSQIVLLGIGVAIIAEGGLSLLGVGVPAGIETPSWGNLIATLRSQLFLGRPWGVFAPSLAIFFTVMSLNYLGSTLR